MRNVGSSINANVGNTLQAVGGLGYALLKIGTDVTGNKVLPLIM
jgi:hypothetical protein